jgi:hypothetical protein
MTAKLLSRIELENLLKKNDVSIKFTKPQQTSRASSVWPRFSLVSINDVVQEFVLCDKCRALIGYKSSTGTGGLKKHLASCDKSASSPITQSSITSYYQNKKPAVVPERIKKEVTRAYTEFVALDGRPFELISGTGFLQLLETVLKAGRLTAMSPSLQISDLLPHPSTVSKSNIIGS